MADKHVEILILGAGWTSTFLLPLLTSLSIPHAATTRTGTNNTITFVYDPSSSSPAPFLLLPTAQTVLIVFPLTGPDQSGHLTKLYTDTHPTSTPPHFIQLGATSVWPSAASGIVNRHTPIHPSHPRGIAESHLLRLGGVVLTLSGLWGAARIPRNWLVRVAPTKEKLAEKGALHLIHGDDVARAIVAVHKNWKGGERWLVTDLRAYDWWDLAMAWGGAEEKRWTGELMVEKGTKVLPRGKGEVGRVLDSGEFWRVFGIWPTRCLVVGGEGATAGAL